MPLAITFARAGPIADELRLPCRSTISALHNPLGGLLRETPKAETGRTARQHTRPPPAQGRHREPWAPTSSLAWQVFAVRPVTMPAATEHQWNRSDGRQAVDRDRVIVGTVYVVRIECAERRLDHSRVPLPGVGPGPGAAKRGRCRRGRVGACLPERSEIRRNASRSWTWPTIRVRGHLRLRRSRLDQYRTARLPVGVS